MSRALFRLRRRYPHHAKAMSMKLLQARVGKSYGLSSKIPMHLHSPYPRPGKLWYDPPHLLLQLLLLYLAVFPIYTTSPRYEMQSQSHHNPRFYTDPTTSILCRPNTSCRLGSPKLSVRCSSYRVPCPRLHLSDVHYHPDISYPICVSI